MAVLLRAGSRSSPPAASEEDGWSSDVSPGEPGAHLELVALPADAA